MCCNQLSAVQAFPLRTAFPADFRRAAFTHDLFLQHCAVSVGQAGGIEAFCTPHDTDRL
jgi:hypothetical protein